MFDQWRWYHVLLIIVIMSIGAAVITAQIMGEPYSPPTEQVTEVPIYPERTSHPIYYTTLDISFLALPTRPHGETLMRVVDYQYRTVCYINGRDTMACVPLPAEGSAIDPAGRLIDPLTQPSPPIPWG